jgi:uridine kinase
VFIDAEEAVKLRRRIIRDNVERGYDLNDVLYRYEHHVAPTYYHYVQPFRSEADLVIPNNKGFERAMEVLVPYLKARVAERN